MAQGKAGEGLDAWIASFDKNGRVPKKASPEWSEKDQKNIDLKNQIRDLIDALSRSGMVHASSDSAGRSVEEKNKRRTGLAPAVRGPLQRKIPNKTPAGGGASDALRTLLQLVDANTETYGLSSSRPQAPKAARKKAAPREAVRTADPANPWSSWTEDRNKRNERSKYLHGAGSLPKEWRKNDAPQPGGRGSSLYESQVPRAARESENRRFVSKADKSVADRTAKDNAVKRLRGKRPVKRGEM